MEGFGQRLRRLRGQRSQREIAEALDIAVTTLSALENQDSVPRGEVLQKLAEFFKVPISSLYRPHSTELQASDAANAWLQELRKPVKARDTVATQSNLDLDEKTKEKIAKRMRQQHAKASDNK